MVRVALQISANLENVEELKTCFPDYSFFLKLTCTNCGETSEKWHDITESEKTQQDTRNSDGFNFYMKCKMCSRENSIDIVEKSNAKIKAYYGLLKCRSERAPLAERQQLIQKFTPTPTEILEVLEKEESVITFLKKFLTKQKMISHNQRIQLRNKKKRLERIKKQSTVIQICRFGEEGMDGMDDGESEEEEEAQAEFLYIDLISSDEEEVAMAEVAQAEEAEVAVAEEVGLEVVPAEELEVVPAEEPELEVVPAEEPELEVVPAEEPELEVVPAEEPELEVVPAEEPEVAVAEEVGLEVVLAEEAEVAQPDLQCICNICGQKFQNKKQLSNHKRSHKPRIVDPAEKNYCALCARSFFKRNQYKRHMEIHVYKEPQFSPPLERYFRGQISVNLDKAKTELEHLASFEEVSEVRGRIYFLIKTSEYEIFRTQQATVSDISRLRLMCNAIGYVGCTENDFHRPTALVKRLLNGVEKQYGLLYLIHKERQESNTEVIIHLMQEVAFNVARVYESLLIHTLGIKIANDNLPKLPIAMRNCLASGVKLHDLSIYILHWACNHIVKSEPMYASIV